LRNEELECRSYPAELDVPDHEDDAVLRGDEVSVSYSPCEYLH